jgi:LuxR family transcriptional regulator, maltose regulon positive regulatory protein
VSAPEDPEVEAESLRVRRRATDSRISRKVVPPQTIRSGVVLRRELVDRLGAVEAGHVVSVAAPAGYGKSTVLAQWLDSDSRSGAWLAVDREDNDPAAMLRDILSSLRSGGVLGADASWGVRFTSGTAVTRGVDQLVGALEGADPGILVIDEAQHLRSRASRDVIGELALRLPQTLTLAVATRSDVRLPMGQLRMQGRLEEIGASDLVLTQEEATELAGEIGVHREGAFIADLLEHTEGWPVAVYLSLLAIKSGGGSTAPYEIRGDDRFIADYLQKEFVGRVSPSRASFLMRSSVLHEFSGDLCDFVLQRTGSHRILETLESSNLLITPLDRKRRWYRYHHVLKEYLQSQLQRDEPESVAALNLRAAVWYEEHGLPEAAIDHAMAAGDEDRAARLVTVVARSVFGQGRIETLTRWLSWFEEAGRIDRHPSIAVLGALTYALLGNEAVARRWAGTMDEGTDLGPVAGVVRAAMCPGGIDQMLADAVAAREALNASSDWHSAAMAFEGMALYWKGDIGAADARFALAAKTAEGHDARPAQAFSIAARSTIMASRGDYAEANMLAEHSVRILEGSGLEEIATSVLPYVTSARAAMRAGDPVQARRMLGRAVAIRPVLSAAAPIIALHTLVEMVEAHLEVGDISGARLAVRAIDDIMRQRPRLGLPEERFADLRAQVAAMPAGHVGASTLTNAELRVLPMLGTHLSFAEIGDRLYVSRHTVKTQAMSIYRKLGASSRSEAVELAKEMYLLH